MLSATWSLSSKPGCEIAVANELIRCIETEIDCHPRLQEIHTVVTEACLNAMEHGNRFDGNKSVQVALSIQADAVIVRIRDEGEGWPDGIPPLPDPQEIWQRDNPRGWGLVFIQAFADRVITGLDGQGFYMELHFAKPSFKQKGTV